MTLNTTAYNRINNESYTEGNMAGTRQPYYADTRSVSAYGGAASVATPRFCSLRQVAADSRECATI